MAAQQPESDSPDAVFSGKTGSNDDILVSVWTDDPVTVEVITKRINQADWDAPVILHRVVEE